MSKYGNAIRYTIPELMPSATSSPPCSTTARHMAHCPNESMDPKKNKTIADFLNMKLDLQTRSFL